MTVMPANNLEDTRAVIGDSLCLSTAWLDFTPSDVALWTVTYTLNPDYWPIYYNSGQIKISLTLSQVMHLRELALEDKKLRKVLKKFAPYIEVVVDFPG